MKYRIGFTIVTDEANKDDIVDKLLALAQGHDLIGLSCTKEKE